MEFEYKPLYNRKEYRLLYAMRTLFDEIPTILNKASYRDKRVQRIMREHYHSAYYALTCPMEEIPTLINHESLTTQTVTKWRLHLGK